MYHIFTCFIIFTIVWKCQIVTTQFINTHRDTQPLDYIYTITHGIPSIDSDGWIRANVSDVDDEPYTTIPLPFTFPYFSIPHSSISINPNGAIMMNPDSICCNRASPPSCVFLVSPMSSSPLNPTCNFATSYMNLIAASITDLNPKQGGEIIYKIIPGQIIVRYSSISLFYIDGFNDTSTYNRATRRMSFIIRIYESGMIQLEYEKIFDPVTDPGATDNDPRFMDPYRSWLVGLRVDMESYQKGIVRDSVYAQAYINDWKRPPDSVDGGTLFNAGIYPPRSAITSNTTLTFYPIGSHACNTPKRGDDRKTYITLQLWNTTIANMGMYECVAPVITMVGNVSVTASYIASSMTYLPDTNTFLCQLPSNPINITIDILIRINGNVLPLPRLTYTYTTTSTSSLIQSLCTECTSFTSEDYCYQDCMGVWRGNATIDECGICSGGTSGHVARSDLDCYGNCFGPFRLLNGVCDCLSVDVCISYFANATGGLDPSSTIQYTLRYVSGLNRSSLTSVTAPSTSLTRAWERIDVGINLAGGIDPNPNMPSHIADGQYNTWIDMEQMNGLSPWPTDHDSAKVISTISSIDQPAHLYQLYLDFEFPFYQQKYRQIYISQNGVLYLSTNTLTPECVKRGSASFFTSTTCQHTMIAASLTDMDLFASHISHVNTSDMISFGQVLTKPMISYWLGKDVVSVKWEGMPLYFSPTPTTTPTPTAAPTSTTPTTNTTTSPPTSPSYLIQPGMEARYTIQLSLFASGKILLRYASIHNPTSYDLSRTWFVGLSRTYINESDTRRAENLVMKNQSFSYLPMPTRACMSPRYGPHTGGTLLRFSFNNASSPFTYPLPALHMECIFSDANITLYTMPSYWNETTNTINCYSPSTTLINRTLEVHLRDIDTHKILILETRMFFIFIDENVMSMEHRQRLESVDTLCGDCWKQNQLYCTRDCYGTFRGTATLDVCGACTGGRTGRTPADSYNCLGVCDRDQRWKRDTRGSCTCYNGNNTICNAFLPQSWQIPTPIMTGTSYVYVQTPYTSTTETNTPITNITSTSQLIPIDLPFTLYVYNIPRRRIYISVNGGIYLSSPSSSCLSNASSSLYSSTSACRHELVAVAYTAWNILSTSTPTPTISYIITSDHITVRWDHMTLLLPSSYTGSNVISSFDIRMNMNGSMMMRYHSMSDVSMYPTPDGSRHVLSGIYYPYTSTSDPIASYGHINASSYDIPTNMSTGTFLPHITSDKIQYTLCRYSLSWCHTPTHGSVGTRITLVTHDMSCLSQLTSLSCTFGDVDVVATYNATVGGITCVAPQGINGYITTLRLKLNNQFIYTNIMTFQYDNTSTSTSTSLCTSCGTYISTCIQDCAGIWMGNSAYDDCGICRAGVNSFGYNSDKDCTGVCFGPFRPQNASFDTCSCPSSTSICLFYSRTDGPINMARAFAVLTKYKILLIVIIGIGLLFSAILIPYKYIYDRPDVPDVDLALSPPPPAAPLPVAVPVPAPGVILVAEAPVQGLPILLHPAPVSAAAVAASSPSPSPYPLSSASSAPSRDRVEVSYVPSSSPGNRSLTPLREAGV